MPQQVRIFISLVCPKIEISLAPLDVLDDSNTEVEYSSKNSQNAKLVFESLRLYKINRASGRLLIAMKHMVSVKDYYVFFTKNVLCYMYLSLLVFKQMLIQFCFNRLST